MFMEDKKVIFEPRAHLNAEERALLNWLIDNFDGQITILAESRQEGIMMPDIACGACQIELKTTSGNLNTLDTLLRKAAKQAHGGCAIVNLVRVSYSLQEACDIALRRMKRSGLNEVYLLKDGITQAHLFQNKEENL